MEMVGRMIQTSSACYRYSS